MTAREILDACGTSASPKACKYRSGQLSLKGPCRSCAVRAIETARRTAFEEAIGVCRDLAIKHNKLDNVAAEMALAGAEIKIRALSQPDAIRKLGGGA